MSREVSGDLVEHQNAIATKLVAPQNFLGGVDAGVGVRRRRVKGSTNTPSRSGGAARPPRGRAAARRVVLVVASGIDAMRCCRYATTRSRGLLASALPGHAHTLHQLQLMVRTVPGSAHGCRCQLPVVCICVYNSRRVVANTSAERNEAQGS